MRKALSGINNTLQRYLSTVLIADFIFLLLYHSNYENHTLLNRAYGCLVALLACAVLTVGITKKPRELLYILVLPVLFTGLMLGKRLLIGRSQIALEPAVMLFNSTLVAFPVAYLLEEKQPYSNLNRILAASTIATAVCMSLMLIGAAVGHSISFFHRTFVFGVEYSASGRVIISMLGMHQYIIGFLASFFFFVALYLIRVGTGLKSRMVYAIAALVFLAVAVLSGSRNVWGALLFGGVLLAALSIRKHRWSPAKTAASVATVIVVSVPVGILLCNILYRYILHSRRDVFYALTTLTSRTTIWRAWFAMIRERPAALLFGLPAPRIMEIMDQYIELNDASPHMHSSFVQALCMFGLPGFLYILSFLYRCATGWYRLWFNGKTVDEASRKLLVIPMAIALLESFLEPILFTSTVCKPLNFLFFLLAGYLFRDTAEEAPVPRTGRRISTAFACCVCLIPVVLLAYSAIAPKESQPVDSSPAPDVTFHSNAMVRTGPGVTVEMLTPSYWHTDCGNVVLMTPEEIHQWNEANCRMIEAGEARFALAEIPEVLSGTIVKDLVSVVDIPSNPEAYFFNGIPTTSEYWRTLLANANIAAIPAQVNVRFGYSVLRSTLRQLPTRDSAFEGDDLLFDKLIRSDYLPFTPLAVVHESADGEWLYVILYGYAGWIEREAVALCESREDWLTRQNNDDFLIVTGSELRLADEPYMDCVSGLLLPMGTKLPLAAAEEIPGMVNARAGLGCYPVRLPVRDAAGMLEDAYCFVPVNADVHEGYLDYTTNNVVDLAFKCLGDRYGWAGDYNAFDCSGYTHAIYACFGFDLPRTGIAQVETVGGIHGSFSGMNEQTRLETIRSLPAGALLYFNGHIMVYLGCENDKPYVISSVSSLCLWDNNDKWVTAPLDANGVCVTSLTETYRASGYSWLNALSDYVVLQKQ